MNRHEDSFLDNSLRDLDSKITWNESSKQQVRKSIISTINKEKHIKSKNLIQTIKNAVIPAFALIFLVGISLPLVLSQINLDDSEPEQSSQIIQSGAESDSKQLDLNYTLPQEQLSKLNDIKSANFDVRLPEISIDKNVVVSNIVKRKAGAGVHVAITFSLNGKTIYEYWQESIGNTNESTIDAAINRIKDSSFKEININSKTAYLAKNERDERLSLYIPTENYGFMLTTSYLTIEELVGIANSINLTELN